MFRDRLGRWSWGRTAILTVVVATIGIIDAAALPKISTGSEVGLGSGRDGKRPGFKVLESLQFLPSLVISAEIEPGSAGEVELAVLRMPALSAARFDSKPGSTFDVEPAEAAVPTGRRSPSSSTARLETDPGSALKAELAELRALVNLQRQQVEAQQKQIEEQRTRLEALETTTSNLETITLSLYDSAPKPAHYQPAVAGGVPYGTGSEAYTRRSYTGYNRGTGAIQPAVVRTETRSAQTQEGQAGAPGAQQKPTVDVQMPAIAEQTTALLKAGTLVVEPSVEYNTTTLNRVILEGFTVIPAITVGSIDIREVDRDVLVGAATVRVGVTDLFELGARVPYVYRGDSTTTRPIGTGASADITTEVSGNGLGDVEFSGHYQVLSGNGWPFVILNGRVKAPTGKDPFDVSLDANGLETELPTGTGFWGLEPGATVLFPSDPVVFFASASYLFNLPGTKTLQTTGASVDVDPGDAARFSFGMGFAINERASFSLGYEHSFVFESEVDGTEVVGSDLQVGSLLIGGSYRASEDTTVNMSVGVGATKEAPDVSLTLRIPTNFVIF